MNESIDQSIDQSINQSINQSMNQSINQSLIDTVYMKIDSGRVFIKNNIVVAGEQCKVTGESL